MSQPNQPQKPTNPLREKILTHFSNRFYGDGMRPATIQDLVSGLCLIADELVEPPDPPLPVLVDPEKMPHPVIPETTHHSANVREFTPATYKITCEYCGKEAIINTAPPENWKPVCGECRSAKEKPATPKIGELSRFDPMTDQAKEDLIAGIAKRIRSAGEVRIQQKPGYTEIEYGYGRREAYYTGIDTITLTFYPPVSKPDAQPATVPSAPDSPVPAAFSQP